jgi:restriction endonuclease Mrr
LSRRNANRRAKESANPVIALVVVLVLPIVLLNATLVWLGLPAESFVTVGVAVFIYLIVVSIIVWAWVSLVRMPKRKAEEERRQELQQRREQQEEERRRKREELEEQRRREEREREEQIEALLQRDAFSETVDHMSGTEFEHFMANVFAKQGYPVQLTPCSGDQGVDLLLTIDERRVAVQLKRHTAPVGNAAVQQALAGMIHYKAKEAWVITTSTFTKSARQLATSTAVRLIDRNELEDWLSDLREEA